MKYNSNNTSGINRRNFLQIGTLSALGLSVGAPSVSSPTVKKPVLTPEEPEWRNKQPEMSYRQLGRTGLMISEVVSGGDPVRLDNYKQIIPAVERGLNYLDMAPAYGGGECEKAYGKLLKDHISREKVFLTTKVSGFNGVRNRMYKEIFDGLPSEKQKKYKAKADQLIEDRGVEKPGYFFTYWPGQANSNHGTFLSNAMAPDYAHKVEGSSKYRKFMLDSIEGSLNRVGTDHFDILMCPHGANSPEEVQIPEIWETFEKIKKQGKVRFLGVTSHNDPAGVLKAAADTGQFDCAMVAYNVLNAGYLEQAIEKAVDEQNMGIIGMKVAMAVATHHQSLQPTPQWRIDKVNRIVPGDMKAPVKAYIWALQNHRVAGVISNLWDENYVNENLAVAGKKVKLQAG